MTDSVEITLQNKTIQQMLSLAETDVAAQLNSQVLAAAAKQDIHGFAQFTDVSRLMSLRTDLATHLIGSLQGNALEMFLDVWARISTLMTAARQSSLHPTDSFPVVLAEHEFTWSIDPVVEVHLNGALLGQIPFSVSLNCKVQSVEFILQAGKIQRIVSGTCDLVAVLSCGSHKIIERPLVKVILPGDFRLTHGLSLVTPTPSH